MAASVVGRPRWMRAERRVHRRRSQSRCHRTTVSGWTSTSAPRQPRLGQHDPKQAISPSKLRTGDGASQRVELLPEREILDDQFVRSATGQRHSADEEKDGLKHASILSCYAQGINVGRAVLILANDNAPIPRPIAAPGEGRVVAIPQVGGLHHRYERQAA